MPDLSLDLRYLKYALLVAEQGSFRRAADILQLSQSTLSRRVQMLERTLGVPLFERTRFGTRPTASGDRFMRTAAIGAEYLHHAVDQMVLARRGDEGELNLGLTGSLSSGFLGDLLKTYRRRFPKVAIKVEEATAQASAAGVLNGRLDAVFIPGNPRLPGCETRHLWDERILAVMQHEHPLASQPNISWRDLRNETFLIAADVHGPEVRELLVRRLSELGCDPRISIQRVGRENLMNMVGKGFGLTLIADSTIGASYPGVKILPVSGREIVSSSVVWSVTNANPALKCLLELGVALSTATDGNNDHSGK
ncbi:LysR family transcriptional regulator [Agrobacterium vitis]|uniref:LysR family transcriptional regulator n=1 Tax=Agrobacterium vitis TaxID=373 RepID=UPI0012E96947|nr:LysR family transcriptional regulator [Agrobacterium vitis]MUZ65650.1 LysR family transcriptional regulator [Agrobacterium vitis]